MNIDNIIILQKLYSLKNELKDLEEKEIIQKLIDKRPKLFIPIENNNFTKKELGRAKVKVNKIFNSLIYDLFPDDWETFKKYEINWYGEENEFQKSNIYNELVLIRCSIFEKIGTPFYKSTMELLDIHTKQELTELINKYFKL
jgi:hypothetical protein